MSESVLRRATADDVEAITALVAEAFTGYVERIGKAPAPMLADYRSLLDVTRIWVVDQDQAIVAVLVSRLRQDHVEVDTVAVALGAQGGGHGSRLLDRAERDAIELGVTEVRLSTNEAMTENIEYYPRRGYVEAGRGIEDGYRRVFFTKTVGKVPRIS